MQNAILWLAQGFGLGRFPVAPGTIGSLGGLLWFFCLVSSGSLWLWIAGCLAGLALSVWACGAAERILQQPDPPSVVLDEIAALPVAFLPWMLAYWSRHSAMPAPSFFLQTDTWRFTVLFFLLFRLFDVWKPTPIRQSQRLPAGWGITADDLLAAAYVALLSLALLH